MELNFSDARLYLVARLRACKSATPTNREWVVASALQSALVWRTAGVVYLLPESSNALTIDVSVPTASLDEVGIQSIEGELRYLYRINTYDTAFKQDDTPQRYGWDCADKNVALPREKDIADMPYDRIVFRTMQHATASYEWRTAAFNNARVVHSVTYQSCSANGETTHLRIHCSHHGVVLTLLRLLWPFKKGEGRRIFVFPPRTSYNAPPGQKVCLNMTLHVQPGSSFCIEPTPDMRETATRRLGYLASRLPNSGNISTTTLQRYIFKCPADDTLVGRAPFFVQPGATPEATFRPRERMIDPDIEQFEPLPPPRPAVVVAAILGDDTFMLGENTRVYLDNHFSAVFNMGTRPLEYHAPSPSIKRPAEDEAENERPRKLQRSDHNNTIEFVIFVAAISGCMPLETLQKHYRASHLIEWVRITHSEKARKMIDALPEDCRTFLAKCVATMQDAPKELCDMF